LFGGLMIINERYLDENGKLKKQIGFWIENGEKHFYEKELSYIDDTGTPHYYSGPEADNEICIDLDGKEIRLHRGDTYMFWYKGNYITHRLGGPAMIINDDCCDKDEDVEEWYYEGKKIDCSSQEEFERILKLRLFL
jgi:hypothetical protein